MPTFSKLNILHTLLSERFNIRGKVVPNSAFIAFNLWAQQGQPEHLHNHLHQTGLTCQCESHFTSISQITSHTGKNPATWPNNIPLGERRNTHSTRVNCEEEVKTSSAEAVDPVQPENQNTVAPYELLILKGLIHYHVSNNIMVDSGA